MNFYFFNEGFAVGEGGERRDIRGAAAFAAEGKKIHAAEGGKHGDAPAGEALRAGAGVVDGQLEHKVGTAGEGALRAQIFGTPGGLAALGQLSAEDDHHRVGELLRLCYVVGVPLVERVVFRDNSGNAHKISPFLKLDFSPAAKSYIAVSRRLCPRSAWVMFCRRRRQRLGVTAVRSHFYRWGARRHTERVLGSPVQG